MTGIPSLFTAEALTSADAAYAQIMGAIDAEVFTELPVLLHQLQEASTREELDKVYELTAVALLMNDGRMAMRNHLHPMVRHMFQLASQEGKDCRSFWPTEEENIERDLQSKDLFVRRYAAVELAGFGVGLGEFEGLEPARQRLCRVVEDFKTQSGKEEEYQYALAF
ncbi:MAG: hypothetical protein HY877_01975 [Deltaproteobacteria bacterium]|nr:hypothetical protein [Deltaproteobacteria bacterium]